MEPKVVITGIGLVTPLGTEPDAVLGRLARGESAFARPTGFDPAPFACRLAAEIGDFDATPYVAEPKKLRLMNRDAVLAAAAARLALADAALRPDSDCPADQVALYGSTGMAGLPLSEVISLVRNSAGPDGAFDPRRFATVAMKRVRPVLSFKILSNMPICFVSMFENIRGPNAVYGPWEGQGAQAIAAGVRAIQWGDAAAAVVGGCDVKTHQLAFIALQQQGAFGSWQRTSAGRGSVPGEGAVFLVLEDERRAARRNARVYARIARCHLATADSDRRETYRRLVSGACREAVRVVAAGDGDAEVTSAEDAVLDELGLSGCMRLRPKAAMGNLYAAAAAVQVAAAATWIRLAPPGGQVLVNCFGHGSEQAVFVLEPA